MWLRFWSVVTRFFATMSPSDSRPVPPDGYVFPPDVGCVAASAPPGLPVSSTNLSLRAVLTRSIAVLVNLSPDKVCIRLRLWSTPRKAR